MKHVVIIYVLFSSLLSLNAVASGGIWGDDGQDNSGGGIWGGSGYGSNIFNRPTGNGGLPEDNSSDYLFDDGNDPVPAGDGLYVLLACALSYAVYISVSRRKKKSGNEIN